jgi:trk system potassium uptake protein TrkA
MKIAIIGDGNVGFTLARQLSKEGHDLVLIDSDQDVLQHAQERLDVLVVVGNGATLEVQREADIGNCDLMVAVTSSDETNLLCCILAKKLGCRHTISRVRNAEYNQQLQYLREDLGLSMAINPELMTAHQIFRSIEFPSFLNLDAFAKGRVELVELLLDEKNALTDRRIDDMKGELRRHILVCAVERDGEVMIPRGGFVFKAGDKITITASRRDLAKVIKQLELDVQKIRNVMIIGGSTIAEYLADDLLNVGIGVKIIEIDEERANELAERLPKALVINDDGSSHDVLRAERIDETDAVVTLTGVDEMNIVISMFSSKSGVPKTITKLDNNEYNVLFADKGIGSTVCPKELITNDILRYVRAMSSSGGSAITLHRIVDEKAEAIEFEVGEDTLHLGEPFSKIPLRKDLLVACITRMGNIIFPHGADCLHKGDTVIIVTTSEHTVFELNDIFTDSE